MAGVLAREDRAIAEGRRELYSRRTGRGGVGPCPNPQCFVRDISGVQVRDEHGQLMRSQVVLVTYVPKNRFEPALRPTARRTRRRGGVEGDAPRLVFDFPAAARGNTYANYASTNAFERARLLPDPEDEATSLLPPLMDHEIRLCLHIARHPECERYLTHPR